MNQLYAQRIFRLCRVPHMRGDEPEIAVKLGISHDEFPTCVGMNRKGQSIILAKWRVPHMRGDEPKPDREKLLEI